MFILMEPMVKKKTNSDGSAKKYTNKIVGKICHIHYYIPMLMGTWEVWVWSISWYRPQKYVEIECVQHKYIYIYILYNNYILFVMVELRSLQSLVMDGRRVIHSRAYTIPRKLNIEP